MMLVMMMMMMTTSNMNEGYNTMLMASMLEALLLMLAGMKTTNSFVVDECLK